MKKFFLLLLPVFALCFLACDDDDLVDDDANESGLTIKSRTESFDAIYADVKSRVIANDFTIVAEVDHAAAADGVDIDLKPTSLIIFGNPMGGTQLMQEDQRIGIDLPLKMLVYQDESGNNFAAYYSGTVLLDRYDIEADNLRDNIDMALETISGGNEEGSPNFTSDAFDNLIVKPSTKPVDELLSDLQSVLTANDFNIIETVQHDVAAAGVGLMLRPTKVVIFGKPAVGSQLMTSNNRIGIDLPQKMLIWEDENGDVSLAYYPASYLADRHDIEDRGDVVDMINTALDDLSDAALN